MALIKCPECGKEVSSTAPSCIHCGYVFQEKEKQQNPDQPEIIIRRRETKQSSIFIVNVILFWWQIWPIIVWLRYARMEAKNNELKKHVIYKKDGKYFAYDLNGNLLKDINIDKVTTAGYSVFVIDNDGKKVFLGYGVKDDFFKLKE